MTSKSLNITIVGVVGREIVDSRGNPTVEAEVRLSNGVSGTAAVPSGASTGSHESLELRDNNADRFGGNGVLQAVSNVNDTIGLWLTGRSPLDQSAIDEGLIALDGTVDKRNLGANAILAVSLAVARAAAAMHQQHGSLWRHLATDGTVSLPVPMFNILNGGRHASNSSDIQEFMVLPVGSPTFAEALRTGAEIYRSLRSLLHADGYNLNVGDEGGFAPSLPSNKDALELVLKAIEVAGYRPGGDVFVGLDVAAAEFYDKSRRMYILEREGTTLSSDQMIDIYDSWTGQYPILSIEDGLDEDDWEGWSAMCRRLGSSVQLVGDDLLVTNTNRILRSIEKKASNAVLLKPNQVGTLTETHSAFRAGRDAGWGAIVSHRSGETEDTTIADLAVGWDVRQIKTGAVARSERVAKYNRLLRIEEELGKAANYAGVSAFEHLRRF